MKRIYAVTVIFGLALLAGCAKNSPAPDAMTQEQINNQVKASLVQSAAQTQASLAELSSIEKTRFQKNNTLPLANINDPALNVVVTLKWNGPIEPLLRQMASLTGYQFQVFGKAPFSPILVNIDDTDNPVSALTIIRNADVQAGLNAQILIYQDQKVISLRYPGS